jgi:hypothetical protein
MERAPLGFFQTKYFAHRDSGKKRLLPLESNLSGRARPLGSGVWCASAVQSFSRGVSSQGRRSDDRRSIIDDPTQPEVEL